MAHASKLISVVIPAYNRTDQVQVAISSALAQQGEAAGENNGCFDLEIIVVDDGSDTPILKHTSSTVHVIRHKTNCGPGAARNTGVHHARGHYIAFLDSDDTWAGRKLSTQVTKLNGASANTFGVFCPFEQDTHLGKLITPRKTERSWFDTFLGGCRVAPGSTLMFRRSLWDEVGPQNETLNRFEDWDWLLRASKSYNFEVTTDGHAVLRSSRRPSYQNVTSSLREIEKMWRPQLEQRQVNRFIAATAIERSAHAKNHNMWSEFIKNMYIAGMKDPGCIAENLRWRFIR